MPEPTDSTETVQTANRTTEEAAVDHTQNVDEATHAEEATNAQASAAAVVADPVLLAARAQARAALEEITPAETIGEDDGYEAHEPHVLTLFFGSQNPGYPGWRWAATLARVDDNSEPTVLEVEQLPGPDAVVAPEWVPWSERLAQYRETQARQARDGAETDDHDEDLDSDDELLDGEFDDDGLDGVDVDAMDDADEDYADEADDTELFDADTDDDDDDESDDDSEESDEVDDDEE